MHQALRVDPSTVAASADIQMFISFLCAALRWDPHTRMTPAEAMRHPWLRDYLASHQQATVAASPYPANGRSAEEFAGSKHLMAQASTGNTTVSTTLAAARQDVLAIAVGAEHNQRQAAAANRAPALQSLAQPVPPPTTQNAAAATTNGQAVRNPHMHRRYRTVDDPLAQQLLASQLQALASPMVPPAQHKDTAGGATAVSASTGLHPNSVPHPPQGPRRAVPGRPPIGVPTASTNDDADSEPRVRVLPAGARAGGDKTSASRRPSPGANAGTAGSTAEARRSSRTRSPIDGSSGQASPRVGEAPANSSTFAAGTTLTVQRRIAEMMSKTNAAHRAAAVQGHQLDVATTTTSAATAVAFPVSSNAGGHAATTSTLALGKPAAGTHKPVLGLGSAAAHAAGTSAQLLASPIALRPHPHVLRTPAASSGATAAGGSSNGGSKGEDGLRPAAAVGAVLASPAAPLAPLQPTPAASLYRRQQRGGMGAAHVVSGADGSNPAASVALGVGHVAGGMAVLSPRMGLIGIARTSYSQDAPPLHGLTASLRSQATGAAVGGSSGGGATAAAAGHSAAHQGHGVELGGSATAASSAAPVATQAGSSTSGGTSIAAARREARAQVLMAAGHAAAGGAGVDSLASSLPSPSTPSAGSSPSTSTARAGGFQAMRPAPSLLDSGSSAVTVGRQLAPLRAQQQSLKDDGGVGGVGGSGSSGTRPSEPTGASAVEPAAAGAQPGPSTTWRASVGLSSITRRGRG